MKHNRLPTFVPGSAICRQLSLVALLTCSTLGFASTKTGVDSAIGNQINDSSIDPVEPLATFATVLTRSPTGLLYISPYEAEAAEADTWSSSIEFGAIFNSGDDGASQFRKYTDWDEGAVLSDVSVMGDFGDTYFNFKGGALGRDDQFLKAEYGRYGSYRIIGFFNEIPHVYADDATLLYQGIGTNVLTLPSPLIPGGNTSDEIANALTSASKGTISANREKFGGELRSLVLGKWKLGAKYTLENRDGVRPFGGSFYPTTIGGAVETLEPIDYKTHEFSLDTSYSGDRSYLNLGVKNW